MEERKKPTKSVIYYYITVLISMILLNSVILPAILKNQIVRVDYGTFLMKVDSGLVNTVNIHEDQILFELKGDNKTAVAWMIFQSISWIRKQLPVKNLKK